MKYKGKDIMVFVEKGGVKKCIAYSTGCELDINRSFVEVASLDTADWEDYKPDKLGWGITCAALVSDEAENELEFLKLIQGGKIYVSFASVASSPLPRIAGQLQPDGRLTYGGYTLLSRLTYTGQMGSMATFSVDFKGTGELA